MFKEVLYPAIIDTLYMVVMSSIFAVIIGFIPAVALVLTDEGGLKPNKVVYKILDFLINFLRSFPFIILMISIFPLTRILTGSTIGTKAAIVPLTIGAAPFAARVIENSLKEIDKGIIEAAKSFGASTTQIIFKVMLKEALPSIVSGITLTVITIIGYSAMAGAIGAGGLGDVAIRYGYQMFRADITIYTVAILIVLVQIFQTIGNLVYKKLS